MKCLLKGLGWMVLLALAATSVALSVQAEESQPTASPREIIGSSSQPLSGQAQLKLQTAGNESKSKSTPSSAVMRSSGAFSRRMSISPAADESKAGAPKLTRSEKSNLQPKRPAAVIREAKNDSSPTQHVVEVDTRKVPDNFIARLVTRLPETLAKAQQTLNTVTAQALSLSVVAADPKFLQAAWISFDAGKKKWQATWPKPPLFHYGMILLPALVDRIKAGETFTFESQGRMGVLSKNEHGQLLVEQDGCKKRINSKDLRELLQGKIDADGLSLYLDRSGNLVLQAVGERALAMAEMNGRH